jgi:hypothetical protein
MALNRLEGQSYETGEREEQGDSAVYRLEDEIEAQGDSGIAGNGDEHAGESQFSRNDKLGEHCGAYRENIEGTGNPCGERRFGLPSLLGSDCPGHGRLFQGAGRSWALSLM